MIVVDVGCAKYGGDYSIERLVAEFHPDVLYGFDPSSAMDDLDGWTTEGTTVHLRREAAWIYDGEIGFREEGLTGQIDEDAPKVPCFDLARFLRVSAFKHRDGIALKIDAEAAEYDLLEHLIAKGADKLLTLAWVEWHPPGAPVNSRPDERREAIEERIRCELHQWDH